MSKLNDMCLDLIIGVNSAMTSSGETREVLKVLLLQTAAFILTDIEQISHLIDEELKNI